VETSDHKRGEKQEKNRILHAEIFSLGNREEKKHKRKRGQDQGIKATGGGVFTKNGQKKKKKKKGNRGGGLAEIMEDPRGGRTCLTKTKKEALSMGSHMKDEKKSGIFGSKKKMGGKETHVNEKTPSQAQKVTRNRRQGPETQFSRALKKKRKVKSELDPLREECG